MLIIFYEMFDIFYLFSHDNLKLIAKRFNMMSTIFLKFIGSALSLGSAFLLYFSKTWISNRSLVKTVITELSDEKITLNVDVKEVFESVKEVYAHVRDKKLCFNYYKPGEIEIFSLKPTVRFSFLSFCNFI